MKPVVQEESTGCGIASCAAISGISYNDAKEVAYKLGIYASDRSLRSDTLHVRRLLHEFGVELGETELPFFDWNSLPNCALLAIKWSTVSGKNYWHWVVFVRGGDQSYVLDSNKSLKQNLRRDFGRMKPKWYIPVFIQRRSTL